MALVETRDKAQLRAFLERRRALNAYALGDLDEPYWQNTAWFTWQENGEITELALLYKGFDPPILLALQNNDLQTMRALMEVLRPLLPNHIYAHLSPGLPHVLAEKYDLRDHGEHVVMQLQHPENVGRADGEGAVALGAEDLISLKEFYNASYPGHWFRDDMIELGPYFGIRNGDGRLVSAGGVHIFSKRYNIATLGNIATLPSHRGQGLAKKVTAKLCQSLVPLVSTIGLNVQAGNAAAYEIYRDLGFEPIANYSEFTLERK